MTWDMLRLKKSFKNADLTGCPVILFVKSSNPCRMQEVGRAKNVTISDRVSFTGLLNSMEGVGGRIDGTRERMRRAYLPISPLLQKA